MTRADPIQPAVRRRNPHGCGKKPAAAVPEAPNAATCPTCGKPIKRVLVGRPRRWCNDSCRREMIRRRETLRQLEAELELERRTYVAAFLRASQALRVRSLARAVAEARRRVEGRPLRSDNLPAVRRRQHEEERCG